MSSTPICGSFDVMISPRFVGLCGTDIQKYRGAQDGIANVLGHEGVGVVTQTGDSVRNWYTGDAVVFNPVNPSNQDEILGHSFPGVFQEQFLVEHVESRSWLIHRIPSELLTAVGALVEPLATAIYSRDLAIQMCDGRVAVVVGDGPIALLNSILLRLSGFETVLMIHGRSESNRWAVRNGFFDRDDVISGRSDVPRNVTERLAGELVDVVIICTPGEAVEQATMDALVYLKPGGLINFVSAFDTPVISLGQGDLNVEDLRRRNHSGIPTSGYAEEFRSADGKVVNVTGQRGTSLAHIQSSIYMLIDNPEPFKKLITNVV